VKIVDFGLARIAVDVYRTMRPALTRTGQVLGTLSYMAPEQGEGRPVDRRADIYSLGATLFHMLSGLRPLDAIQGTGGAPSLARVAPWVDGRLAGIVARAMADRPEERFASAEEMDVSLVPFAPPPSGSGPLAGPPRQEGTGFASTALAAPATVSLPPSPSAPTPSMPMAPTMPMAPPLQSAPTMPAVAPQPERHMRLLLGLAIAIVVVAMAILTTVPWMMRKKAEELSTAPVSDTRRETIAARAIATSQAIKPCPAPLRCSRTVSDHGVDYALCEAADPRTFTPGTIVLVRTPERARLAIVMVPPATSRVDVTLMTTVPSRRETVDADDIFGAACRP
jgi:Protein kinase domain